MTDQNVVHATVIVERVYPAKPSRVFSAWADPKQRREWDVPSSGWIVAEQRQDFRIGGEEYSAFGPKGDARYISKGIYLDIVPNERIVSAGTMHFHEMRSSSTLCTVELTPSADGTLLKLTDQSVYYGGGEKPADRTEGWNEIADKLGQYLAG